jgi:hypothetical protein
MGIGQVLFPGEQHIEEYELEASTADFKNKIVERNKQGAQSDEPYTVTTGNPCILGGVFYFLPGDETRRVTYSPFQIRAVAEQHPGWIGEECVVSNKELAVRLGFMGGFVK